MWQHLAGSLGVILTLSWARTAWPLWQSILRPRFLGASERPSGEAREVAPLVSIIVPACNEGEGIGPCLESLLAQRYAPLEIIAINDRSTDATGQIMDAIALRDPRLRVLHILELPSAWLGKNYANHAAASTAGGRWLLFTDGDVCFLPSALRLAVAFAESEGLDHLCVFPGLICNGYFEKSACCFFGLLFFAALDVTQVRNPLRPGAFCGVGAFNLVRAEAYRAIGGHERLRLEVADDVKLGKLLKCYGFVTDILAGWPEVTVRWQEGFRGVIRGLEKNAFAGTGYRIGRVLFGVSVLIAFALVPIAGSAWISGWGRWVFIAWLAGQLATLAAAARRQGFSWTVGLANPIACLAVAWAIARSAVLTLRRGGVQWRTSFYPLAELRRGVV